MAQSSFPFENLDTNETQFSQWATNFQKTGVKGIPGDTNLLVLGDNSGMQVRVNAGEAFVRGFYYYNSLQATVVIPAAPSAGLSRIDSIVLNLDVVANSIVLAVVSGTAATTGTQVAPALTQTTTGIYQLLLANVNVTGGASSILSTDVTDWRTFMGNQIGVWTTATRPAGPVANLTIGWNSTINAHEVWNGSAWVLWLTPTWTSVGRPASPVLGQSGFNTTLLINEVWNGTAWVSVAGDIISPFLLMGA